MVNNVYGVIINQRIIDDIQSKLINGSKFQHDSKLEYRHVYLMALILKEWNESFTKYYTYKFKR